MPVCLCPSVLSMFSREGLWGVGGLYGHSSWARRPHIMRWVPQAQRPPNTMGSAQPSLGKGCGVRRKLYRTKGWILTTRQENDLTSGQKLHCQPETDHE